MKRGIVLIMIFCTGLLFSQNKSLEPTYKQKGELVAVTTYYENGSIKEQGFYKGKKLHGEWVKFNKNGEKIAKAFYTDGVKDGTWLFLKDGKFTEVVYQNNTIVSVSKLKEGSL